MELNFEGLFVGIYALAVIGVFHPVVIWGEYYFGDRIWPLFLLAGAALLAGSLFVRGIGAALLGILGTVCLWCILDLKQQARRVEKGWFPANPNRRKTKLNSSGK